MRDVMYPKETALHSWDWNDAADNGIISAVCTYAGVPVESSCSCAISNMGGACFTGIPKSQCGNPLADKYPEYDKGLLICKGTPPFCEESSSPGVVSCADCTDMYVRGRGPGNSPGRVCTGSECDICTGTRVSKESGPRGGVCAAFCLHTKENLWGAEGLPSSKTFTHNEMMPWEKLFTQLGENVPDSCLCERPYANSDFGRGTPSSGYQCYNCDVVKPDEQWNFSACTGSSWCDKFCIE